MVLLPSRGVLTVGRDAEANLPIASPSRPASISPSRCAAIRARSCATSALATGPSSTAPGSARRGPIGRGAELVAGDLRCAVLRRDTLPPTTRPLLPLASFEAALHAEPAAAARGVLAAFGLTAPFYAGSATLEALARLPEGAIVGVAGDEVLLLSAPAAAVAEWLLAELGRRGVAVKRHAPARPSGAGAMRELLAELGAGWGAAPASVPAPEDRDLPAPFRYPSLRKLHDDMRRIASRPISVLVDRRDGHGQGGARPGAAPPQRPSRAPWWRSTRPRSPRR